MGAAFTPWSIAFIDSGMLSVFGAKGESAFEIRSLSVRINDLKFIEKRYLGPGFLDKALNLFYRSFISRIKSRNKSSYDFIICWSASCCYNFTPTF